MNSWHGPVQSKPELRWCSTFAASDKLRFLIAGSSTTAISYGLYLGLLMLEVRAMPAYVISYLAGIIWSYAINALWVFRSMQAAASFIMFPWLLELGAARWAAPLIITLTMIPLTYLLSRAILRR